MRGLRIGHPPGVIFWDDFNGPSIDGAKWRVLQRLSDQVNGELDAVLAVNASVSNGVLEGVSKFEDYTIGDSEEAPKLMHYTSWHLQQKTDPFLYGTIEARVKMPGGTGLWPLVWMLGYGWQPTQPYTANTPEGVTGWPGGQWCEIDIAEFMSNSRTVNNCAVWFANANTGNGSAEGATLPYAADSRYMVYRLQWSASALIWSVNPEDGNVYDGGGFLTLRTITDPVQIPNVPMYVILSTAIGGTGGGTPNSSTFPQTYRADWVRVTQ
jgi:beta-glucanase (GH16 family)